MLGLALVLLSATAVDFGAEAVHYTSGSKVAILVDSAWVSTGKTHLTADSIVYFSGSRIIWAYGNCVLVIESDTMTGDSLAYNLELKDGVMWNGRAHVEKGWITGETMVKLGDDQILIKNGSFTTCDSVPPHYRFVTKRMKLENKEIGVVQPLVLTVHDLPVLYAPFWFFPLRKERHSGFLMPSVGYNTVDGKYLRRLRYYLVINNYSDATFGMDIIEKRGVKFDFQGVYRLYKRFNGEVNLSWANDIYTHRIRWSASGRHFQDFGHGWRLRGEGNFMSDREFNQDYSEQHTEWLKQDMRSFLSLSKRFSFASFNMSLNRYENLATGSGSYQAPSLSFNLFSKSFWRFNVSASSVFQRAGSFDSTTSTLRWGWRNNVQVSAQFKLLRYINFTPNIRFVSTVFDTNILGQGPFEVHGFSGGVTFSTVLYGMSLFGIGPIKRFRHTLRPSLSYRYSPDVPRDTLTAPFGQFSRLPSGIQQGGFSISNDFDARLKDGRIISLFSLIVTESYDLKRDKKPLNPIMLSAHSSPFKKLNLRAGLSIDPYTGKWSNASLNTGLSFSVGDPPIAPWDTLERRWSVSLFHTLSKISSEVKATQRMAVSISGYPTPKWKIQYRFNYNPETGKIVDQSLSLQRDLHCWAFSLRWSKLGDRANYDFRLWIKAMPDVELKKSLLELFLP